MALKKCPACDAPNPDNRNDCFFCHAALAVPQTPPPPTPVQAPATLQQNPVVAPAPRHRVVAGVMGLLLGFTGLHRFYTGYRLVGFILLAMYFGGLFFFGFFHGVGIAALESENVELYNFAQSLK